ncbi:hypothetical protein NC651_008700 [Populus alba x Populus x berolinensis]|nr:hypothetical protein NC651_008700 [Populus alba x Populus x berolinensis]
MGMVEILGSTHGYGPETNGDNLKRRLEPDSNGGQLEGKKWKIMVMGFVSLELGRADNGGTNRSQFTLLSETRKLLALATMIKKTRWDCDVLGSNHDTPKRFFVGGL